MEENFAFVKSLFKLGSWRLLAMNVVVFRTSFIFGSAFKCQPFWFHNLNSMVPVEGKVLFNLVFLSHLFFLFLLLL